MTVQNIYDFLKEKFPLDTACDFDNVGLLVGNPDNTVNNVLIALDCTDITVENAVKNGCNLIVTHHPVIFEPLKNVLKGSIVYSLIENKISVISMHTNLDVGVGGVNDSLCKAISLSDIETVIAEDGYVLRKGSLSPISADALAEKLKNDLGGCIKYVDGGKKIETVLVCSGSGGNFLSEAVKHNCDAFVTADVKHNQFLEAKHLGLSLFDAGHFNTEDVVVPALKEMLENKFNNISFICDRTSFIKNR